MWKETMARKHCVCNRLASQEMVWYGIVAKVWYQGIKISRYEGYHISGFHRLACLVIELEITTSRVPQL
jgi:hypothetical protein